MGLTNSIPEKLPGQVPRGPPPLPPGRGAKIGLASLLLACWLTPAVWVALTPPLTPPHKPLARTRLALSLDNKAMHAFLGKYHKTPQDLSTLRAFALSERLRFDAFDGYGQRLDFLRLDDNHYLLRSFGEDQTQSTVTMSHDMGVVHWGPRPERSLAYRYSERPEPALFPAVLLPGADSPDRQWHARLFVDPRNLTRQLIVRHRTRADVFMVARHDAVEEFLWLPNGRQIVYTATDSLRSRDGIFLWTLEGDTVVNLLDIATDSLPISPAKAGAKLWVSLAGVSRSGPTVFAYQHVRHDGSLDPSEFFAPAQLLAFVVSDRPGVPPRPVSPASLGLAQDASPLAKRLDTGANIDGAGGLKGQQAWLKLAVTGDIDEVLLAWDQYSERASASPLYPYALWTLSALYAESAAALPARQSKEAATLRNFGAEIAKALLNYPLAPSYLRGLALYSYQSLSDGLPLPYRFARLTSPPEGQATGRQTTAPGDH